MRLRCFRFKGILTLPQFRPFLSDDRAAWFGGTVLPRRRDRCPGVAAAWPGGGRMARGGHIMKAVDARSGMETNGAPASERRFPKPRRRARAPHPGP